MKVGHSYFPRACVFELIRVFTQFEMRFCVVIFYSQMTNNSRFLGHDVETYPDPLPQTHTHELDSGIDFPSLKN